MRQIDHSPVPSTGLRTQHPGHDLLAHHVAVDVGGGQPLRLQHAVSGPRNIVDRDQSLRELEEVTDPSLHRQASRSIPLPNARTVCG